MPRVADALKKHQAEQAKTAEAKRPAAVPPSGSPIRPKRTAEAKPKGNNYSPALVAHNDRGGRICEQYRVLRTNLLAKYNDERFGIVLTSAEAGEGKTVTCLNLALVLAELPERQTIIVDCDMRRARIAMMLQAENSPGMADLLRGSATVDEVTQPTAFPNLSVISAGKARQDEVGEIMGRAELDEIVGQLRNKYDYVLFDTPPINAFSDAGVLGQAVGEALLVVRMNKTPREHADRAMRLLHAANVKVAGICLSHQKYFIPTSYLYRYT